MVCGDSRITFAASAPLERKQNRYAEFAGLLSLGRRHLNGVRVGVRNLWDGFFDSVPLARHHCQYASFSDSVRWFGAT